MAAGNIRQILYLSQSVWGFLANRHVCHILKVKEPMEVLFSWIVHFCFVLFFQETSSSIASSELISDDKMDIERDSRKRKFEKVAVTWP